MAFNGLKVLTFLGVSMLGTTTSQACDNELNIVYFNSEPYHYEDTDGHIAGLDVEILEETLKAAGCTWRYTKMPLKRSLSAISAGLADIAMGASATPEREKYAYFTSPYRRELMVMFMRKGETANVPQNITSLADLSAAKVRIGAHLGSWYGYEYARLFERSLDFRMQVLQSADYENLYRALLSDRVDVVIDDIFNGHALLKRLELLSSTDIHPHVVNDSVTHFMLSRKSVSGPTVERIDAAIGEFQHSDAYRKIITHYVPEEYLKRYPLLSASPAMNPARGDSKPPGLHAR